jgi:hypothetical protein
MQMKDRLRVLSHLIHQAQPYVILLHLDSGIRKRLELNGK